MDRKDCPLLASLSELPREDTADILPHISTIASLPWVKCKCGQYAMQGLEEYHQCQLQKQPRQP